MIIFDKRIGSLINGAALGSSAYEPIPVVIGAKENPSHAGAIKTLYWHLNKRENLWLVSDVVDNSGIKWLRSIDLQPAKKRTGCWLLHDMYEAEGNLEGYALYMKWQQHQISHGASGRSEIPDDRLPKMLLEMRTHDHRDSMFKWPENEEPAKGRSAKARLGSVVSEH